MIYHGIEMDVMILKSKTPLLLDVESCGSDQYGTGSVFISISVPPSRDDYYLKINNRSNRIYPGCSAALIRSNIS